MQNKLALELIQKKHFCDTPHCTSTCEYATAAEALKKRIPMDVKENVRNEYGICPSCGSLVLNNYAEHCYCNDCGQEVLFPENSVANKSDYKIVDSYTLSQADIRQIYIRYENAKNAAHEKANSDASESLIEFGRAEALEGILRMIGFHIVDVASVDFLK